VESRRTPSRSLRRSSRRRSLWSPDAGLREAGPLEPIAQGSPNVFINDLHAARVGDVTQHGGVIVTGAPSVQIGDEGAGGSSTCALASASEGSSEGDGESDGALPEGAGNGTQEGPADETTLITRHVLLFGGFFDSAIGSLGGNSPVESVAPLLSSVWPDVSVRYFTHDEQGAGIAYIQSILAAPGDHRFAIVGHSYGGDTGYLVARDAAAHISCLLTVDAVSRWTFSISKPSNVSRWINVYVDGIQDPSDIIAILGGHWGAVGGAENHGVDNLSHAAFYEMARPYLPEVRQSLG